MTTPVIWLSRPSMGEILGVLNEKCSIYHVVDEYSSYGGLSGEAKELLLAQENELLSSADLTIVVSNSLLAAKRDQARRVCLVPNAVDYGAYGATGPESPRPIPQELKTIQQPVIGYSGLIGRRLDLEMLGEIASKRKNWSFVLVGAVRRADCEEILLQLDAMDNVHFPGIKPISDAPNYVKAFDVCMIPYRNDERATYSSPRKIYEYAAAEKPIVCTRFSVALEMSEIVLIADDTPSFESAIEEALAWPSSHPRIERGATMARENTWDHRLQEVAAAISATVNEMSSASFESGASV